MSQKLVKMNIDKKEGEMVIPSEHGNILAPCTVNQFILHATRNYTGAMLANMPGMKVSQHVRVDSIFDSEADFVYLNISFKPKEDLKSFMEDKGDEFFETLMKILSFSDKNNTRGNRAVFLGEFQKELMGSTEVFSYFVLISNSVFYNDYRVTTSYPSDQDETDSVVESIYNRLVEKYPDIKFEVTGQLFSEVEDKAVISL